MYFSNCGSKYSIFILELNFGYYNMHGLYNNKLNRVGFLGAIYEALFSVDTLLFSNCKVMLFRLLLSCGYYGN